MYIHSSYPKLSIFALRGNGGFYFPLSMENTTTSAFAWVEKAITKWGVKVKSPYFYHNIGKITNFTVQ